MAKTIEKTDELEEDEVKQIPSTIVLSILLIVFASWPSIDALGERSLLWHLALHACYLAAGCLFGLQMVWWAFRERTRFTNNEESRVSS
jgi:hypothetical protein